MVERPQALAGDQHQAGVPDRQTSVTIAPAAHATEVRDLPAAADRLRALLGAGPDDTVTVERDGHIILANARIEHLLAYLLS